MIWALVRLSPILIGVVVGSGLLFFGAEINLTAYQQIEDDLRTVAQLDSELNRHLVDVRYGAQVNLDVLANPIIALRSIMDNLDVSACSETSDERAIQTVPKSQALKLFVHKKQTLIEQFKSSNALYNNSLNYLLYTLPSHPQNAPDLKQNNTTRYQLRDAVLEYGVAQLNGSREQLLDYEAILQQTLNQSKSEDEIKQLDNLLRHVHLLLVNKPLLDDALKESLDISLKRESEYLIHECDDHAGVKADKANSYRSILFVLAAIMMIYMVYLFLKQSRQSSQLVRINNKLRGEIQQRLKAGNALRTEHERFLRAQRVALVGNWEWDRIRREITWSDQIFRMFGYAPDAFIPTYSDYLLGIHSEDRKRVDHHLRALSSGDQNEPTEVEYRIRRPDGTVLTIRERSDISHDREGRVVLLIGTILDISHLRQMEERLETATRIFSEAIDEVHDQLQVTTKVFEHVREGVVITDPHGVPQSVNPAFTAITGYTEHDVVGHEEGPEGFFWFNLRKRIEDWHLLTKDGHWSGEFWNRRKSGELYPEERHVTALRDQKGVIQNLMVVLQDQTGIKSKEAELSFRRHHDPLTTLPVRDIVHDRLQQAIRESHRTHTRVAAVALDLDHFKKVNDRFGFSAGDSLLRELADRMRDRLREGDTIGRVSGDEFLAVFRNIPDERGATQVIRRLRSALDKPFLIESERLFFTASIGISLFPTDGNNADILVKNAGLALNRAKESGRDGYHFYTDTMGKRVARRLTLESEIRQGIEDQTFILHYQPKVALKSGQLEGAEVLIRWESPQRGLVSPGEFIPVAEETGLILPLGEWILRTVCVQWVAWHEQGLNPPRLAVNLSARQFQTGGDLLTTIKKILQETGMPPAWLELELTESMVMGSADEALETMNSLRELGTHLAMDDFGTGYSSLSVLKKFPIQTLKIDRSFIRDVEHDNDDRAIVSAIISMARSLKLQVVAEGVEEMEQVDILREFGCDQIQGFLYSRPVDTNTFAKYLQNGLPKIEQ
ncbi:MAG: EAL domain-containing protein [Magnetococcales bacterium]|nr:EAL domain-containing protein [Magnetococcales bacterium]